MQIRAERPEDASFIHELTTAAFESAPYSGGNEADIVDRLRAAGALTVSLVAVDSDEVVGHVAFSPVTISMAQGQWCALGPISVQPARQGRGIGKALVTAGLEALETLGVSGCVLLGAPAYYGRFGFESDEALRYGGVASPYLQRVVLRGAPPTGEVHFHPAFGT